MTETPAPLEDQRRRSAAAGARSNMVARLLDRYGGSWALRLIAFLRPRHKVPPHPRNIGLFVINAIGDTLLVSAIVADLRASLPGARITMVVSETNRGVVPLIPAVDDCVELPLFRPHKAIPLVRGRQFDLLIDMTQWARVTAIYTALSGACGIGFRTAGQYRHYGYDYAIAHAVGRHELDNYRALLAPIGVVPCCAPHIVVPPAARAAIPDRLRQHPYVVLHPWAGGENGWRREWPTDRWVTLGGRLIDAGYALVVTGGHLDRSETDKLVAAAASRGVAMQPFAGELSLAEVAALVEGAAAVVCVNTGLMHLAACLDVPLVALHGPTDPERWGPLSLRSAVILPSEGPRAYLNLGFEYPKDVVDSMPFISVDAVHSALLNLLEGGPAVHDEATPLPWQSAHPEAYDDPIDNAQRGGTRPPNTVRGSDRRPPDQDPPPPARCSNYGSPPISIV